MATRIKSRNQGRLDLIAIGVLEQLVGSSRDLAIRGVYGTYKRDIDQALRKHLGRVRIFIPESFQLPKEAQPAAKRPAVQQQEAIPMTLGPDGVYEVSDAR